MVNYILKEIMGDNFPADEIIKNNEQVEGVLYLQTPFRKRKQFNSRYYSLLEFSGKVKKKEQSKNWRLKVFLFFFAKIIFFIFFIFIIFFIFLFFSKVLPQSRPFITALHLPGKRRNDVDVLHVFYYDFSYGIRVQVFFQIQPKAGVQPE
jgi:hypothetical protein